MIAVSIHATLAGGDVASLPCYSETISVSIHATLAGGDGASLPCYSETISVSSHATLAGGDLQIFYKCRLLSVFLSTPPSRVATESNMKSTGGQNMFLSTPPSRVATESNMTSTGGQNMFLSTPPSRVATKTTENIMVFSKVSIHATLAGGDDESFPASPTPVIVSIHATLAGGDKLPTVQKELDDMFLSTPPSRVATVFCSSCKRSSSCFYPRHPRGWRLPRPYSFTIHLCFYPRHPRGWRLLHSFFMLVWVLFLSTPPSRVATSVGSSVADTADCFYPRHPRGWRRDTPDGGGGT